MARGGFRVDWRPPAHGWFTLQGDMYDGELGDRVMFSQFDPPYRETLRGDADVSGGNVLGRWTRPLSSTSEVALQMYYDHTFRRDLHFREQRDTFDVDGQHRFNLPYRQEIVWGLNYRLTADQTGGVPGIEFVPADATDHLVTAFVQNEIEIVQRRVFLTIGTKLEHNDYSGVELQPSARLSYTPFPILTLWGSIGRAVRTPSRLEHDAEILAGPQNLDPSNPSQCSPAGDPCVFNALVGNHDFDSEELLAYQLGWRFEARRRVFVDTVAFYQDYDELLTAAPGGTSNRTV
jgi:iron complex outermembrane receptor protein